METLFLARNEEAAVRINLEAAPSKHTEDRENPTRCKEGRSCVIIAERMGTCQRDVLT